MEDSLKLVKMVDVTGMAHHADPLETLDEARAVVEACGYKKIIILIGDDEAIDNHNTFFQSGVRLADIIFTLERAKLYFLEA